MVLSLHRCLSRLVHQRPLPGTGQELKDLLVDKVLRKADLYKKNLNRESHKQLRLMRHRGQLLSFDLLVAASHLFELKIHVCCWPLLPILFQFDFCHFIICNSPYVYHEYTQNDLFIFK